MDDGAAIAHRRFNGARVANVAFNKQIRGIVCDPHQIFEVAGVRQLVIVDDGIVFPRGEDVADEVGPDKAGPPGHQNFQRGNLGAAVRSFRCETLLAPVSATRLLARNRDSNVPASVHQPSRISYVRFPSAM